MNEIYLDSAASTPIDYRVLNAFMDASVNYYGNPSNLTHQHGRAAKQALERARQQIGEYLNIDPRGIIFTSGATEANNLALRGITCLQKKRCSAFISAIEHACVDESTKFLIKRGVRVRTIPVMSNGQVDIKALIKGIKADRHLKLISTLLVNNETGVIQPLGTIIEVAKKADKNILIHTDAVQAVGKLNVDLSRADLVSLSGHKINGPKGVGMLWVKPGLKISPLLVGGGQERGIRSGTTPVPLIIALAKAIEISIKDASWLKTVGPAMQKMENTLVKEIPGTIINGKAAPRIPTISNLSFSLNDNLSKYLNGLVAASVGAACSCNKPQPSKVLTNMGLSENLAANCLRLSANRQTSVGEITKATQIIIREARKLL